MKNFSLFLLLSLSLTASSQQLLTLDDAISLALKNNYDIQLSRNDSAVAALDYSFRNAAFIPKLNGNLGTTWNDNNQKQVFADGTKREANGVKSNNINANLALNWTLFDGMKMFVLRDKAQQFVQLGELAIKNQVVNTVATIINNYYNIVRQQQQLKAILEQMSINEERVKLAQYKLDIGVGTKPDILQSKVDLNAQKAAILTQETLIAQLKEDLNQLMGLTVKNNFTVTDSIPVNHNILLGDIQHDIDKTNPLLQLGKKNIEIAGLTLKEKKADRFPVLSFNSNYNFTRTDNKVVVNPFQPLFSRNKGLNYGLTASIPILNNLTTKRGVKQAELDIRYQQLLYDNQRSLISLSIINAWKDYEQQKKALDLEESNILLAKENVDIVFQTYKLGAATFLQLREAQKSLEDAYNRLIAARYNTKLAETELLRLKGDLVQ